MTERTSTPTDAALAEHAELEAQLADPGVHADQARARELGRTPIVVGDRVGLVGETGGGPDALARIVRVDERSSVLRRTAEGVELVEVAPGIDIERDILAHMAFRPLIPRDPAPMDPRLFRDAPM